MTPVQLNGYKEAIKIMMRHGTSVDSIAMRLGCKEQVLVDYIKSEGIDLQLRRRAWKWKGNQGNPVKRKRKRDRKVGSVRWLHENGH